MAYGNVPEISEATAPTQRSSPTAESAGGLGPLLADLLSTIDAYGLPAVDALTQLLTFGGRLPLEHAVDALGSFDEAVFRLIEGRPRARLVPPSAESGEGFVCDVYVSSLGRFHIRDRRGPPPAYHPSVTLHQIGSLHLDTPTAWAAFDRAAACDEAELVQRRRIDEWLFGVEQAGGASELLTTVNDAVRHVEAVCFYVDDELFCNMEGLATLVDKANEVGVLTRLRPLPIVQWSPAHRLAVAALQLLFLSGRSVRFEEFNGKALTAARLMTLFERLTLSYLPIGEVRSGASRDLGAWASDIRRLALDSPGKAVLRYRWISGVTYLKTERVIASPTPEYVAAETPDWALRWYERRFGRTEGRGWRQLFEELADDAIARTLEREAIDPVLRPATSPIETLIQQIVWSAAERTDAHYSMSSSLREPARLLVEDAPARREVTLGLRPADFYCCIASRPELRASFGDHVAAHVYRAVQNRMQFNRWHFIAGNYVEVPSQRHYFYPPAVPDLAEWSDLRHPGHTRASVRYSVRCPGPDMHEPPLMIGGHEYRGFYDVRVVRIHGSPFTVEDMLRVRCHLLWMGVVWERMVDAIQRSRAGLCIRGFTAGEGYEGAGSSQADQR